MKNRLKVSIISFWSIVIIITIILPWRSHIKMTQRTAPSSTSTVNKISDIPAEKVKRGIQLQTGYENWWDTIYDNLEYRQFLISGDYFIVGTGDYGPRAQVYALNLKTGKELILYNELTDRLYINQIKRIENTLFFSTGGYLANGALYYTDFPLEENRTKKVDRAHGTIKEIAGRYWIVDSDGDVCMSFGSYSLFDPKSKGVIHIAEVGNDCGIGNHLQILPDKALNFYFVGNQATSTYTYINWFDLNNPSKELMLIGTKTMPKAIHKVAYDAQSDSLFLYGPEKYIFNLKDNTLVKKDFLEPDKKIEAIQTLSPEQQLKSLILPPQYRILSN